MERFHCTLTEILRCLKTEKLHANFIELLDRTVYEYNSKIPKLDETARQENIEAIIKKQGKDLENHNKNRRETKR